jgi:chromosome segregation ATPase
MDNVSNEALFSILKIIQEDVSFTKRKLLEIQERMFGLEERMTGLDEHMTSFDKRLDFTNKRLDLIDRRFEAVEIRFDETYRRFDDVVERIDTHRHMLINQGDRLERIEGKLGLPELAEPSRPYDPYT